jgi:hypothetical protein
MADKSKLIKNAYIAYVFPGDNRFYTLLHKDHKPITTDDIKKYLRHQEAEQI